MLTMCVKNNNTVYILIKKEHFEHQELPIIKFMCMLWMSYVIFFGAQLNIVTLFSSLMNFCCKLQKSLSFIHI